MRVRHSSLFFLFAAFCLLLPCLSGCGKKQATVKGKITFMNQPLTTGTISFVGNGHTGSGTIKSDGTYLVPNAPVGEVTITVQTPPLPPGGVLATPPPPKGFAMPKEMLPPDYKENDAVRVVSTPEKYAKAETSTLKYTVKSGTQDYDFDLKP